MKYRKLTQELMDDSSLDPVLHEEALRGLSRLNALGFSNLILWKTLKPFIAEITRTKRRPCRILDVACGAGEGLASLVKKANGKVRGLGVDISPVAVKAASRSAVSHVRYQVCDVMSNKRELPSCDVAVCSLFFHHLRDRDCIELLKRMKHCASSRVVILDLERSRLNWLMIGAAGRLVTRSRVVHFDSLRSVEAGWKRAELALLAKKAGIENPKIRRAFPSWLILEFQTG